MKIVADMEALELNRRKQMILLFFVIFLLFAALGFGVVYLANKLFISMNKEVNDANREEDVKKDLYEDFLLERKRYHEENNWL